MFHLRLQNTSKKYSVSQFLLVILMSKLNFTAHQHLYYSLISGNPGQPYLVFLHEGLGCSAMWKDFPEQLCTLTGCPGLVYDRLGYGLSSSVIFNRDINYLKNYAQDELPKVLDALIPNKPYILIGHSDGGSISLIYAAENPPLLLGIITEAAHVFVDSETIAGIGMAVIAFEQGKLNGLYKYHGNKTDSIFKAWCTTWLSEWFRHWSIEDLLPLVQCPVLVIQGNDDQYGTLLQVESIVSSSSGKTQSYIVENCGHSPHSDKPEEVLPTMANFIFEIKNKEFQCE